MGREGQRLFPLLYSLLAPSIYFGFNPLLSALLFICIICNIVTSGKVSSWPQLMALVGPGSVH